MQLPPSFLVSSIVKHYLILKNEKDAESTYRLFSDGNPGIVFHLRDPLVANYDQYFERPQPRSFLYGQITHFNDVKSAGQLDMLIVVLQPNAIHALLDLPATELSNATISLSDLFGRAGTELEDQVLNAKDSLGAIKTIEQLLLKKINEHDRTDVIVQEALHLIYKDHGMISVFDLLQKLPVTERQLERKFKQQIGTGPKKFIDIIKFQHFLKSLQKWSPDTKLANVIYDCGYYDQAHLNNCFKKSAGITPLQYKTQHNLLAINFMQVK